MEEVEKRPLAVEMMNGDELIRRADIRSHKKRNREMDDKITRFATRHVEEKR